MKFAVKNMNKMLNEFAIHMKEKISIHAICCPNISLYFHRIKLLSYSIMCNGTNGIIH